ncbi:MAG: hypothetical protein D3926_04815 [Desulfobacteraceae bacterium]|nr:MAG: hypothetical protein D3926_04815 [Desulfobacteraceae bacterium]
MKAGGCGNEASRINADQRGTMLKMTLVDIISSIRCEVSPLPDTRKDNAKGMSYGVIRIDPGGLFVGKW